MLTEEQIAYLDALSDEDRLCEVCIYAFEGCEGGVHGGPNGPMFPPCTESDYEHIVDMNALEDLMLDEPKTN